MQLDFISSSAILLFSVFTYQQDLCNILIFIFRANLKQLKDVLLLDKTENADIKESESMPDGLLSA